MQTAVDETAEMSAFLEAMTASGKAVTASGEEVEVPGSENDEMHSGRGFALQLFVHVLKLRSETGGAACAAAARCLVLALRYSAVTALEVGIATQ